jgi:hypothetical protein
LKKKERKKKNPVYKKAYKKARMGSPSTRNTRQIKAPKHNPVKNITIETLLIHK